MEISHFRNHHKVYINWKLKISKFIPWKPFLNLTLHYHGNGTSKSYYKMFSFMNYNNWSLRLCLKMGVTVKGLIYYSYYYCYITYYIIIKDQILYMILIHLRLLFFKKKTLKLNSPFCIFKWVTQNSSFCSSLMRVNYRFFIFRWNISLKIHQNPQNDTQML